jgi:hypothetical protein
MKQALALLLGVLGTSSACKAHDHAPRADRERVTIALEDAR